MGDLRKHFPGLFESADGTAKVWAEQIARLASNQPYQLLTSTETERLLDQTLRLRISDPDGNKMYELTEFPKFLKHPSAKTVLAWLGQDLTQLATRANPIYRPIIYEYAQVTALLARGKTRGVASRLERLRETRQAVSTQMRGIDDYLNWFEATKLGGPSGAFSDYMKAAESAARPQQTRRDPISVYLDVLEAQFEH